MSEEPGLRVGDRERAAVDARLRTAHDEGVLSLVEYDERSRDCYAARFRRDLDVLVADLPTTAAPVSMSKPEPVRTGRAEAATGPAAQPPASREAHHGRRGYGRFVLLGVVAVIALVVGPGVLGADQGAAVFGGRTVTAGSGPVQVGVLFGGVTVVVPDGTRATTSGTVIFGGVDCDQACTTPLPPGAPQVDVSARGAFGGVTVETATEAARGGISDHDSNDHDSDDHDDD